MIRPRAARLLQLTPRPTRLRQSNDALWHLNGPLRTGLCARWSIGFTSIALVLICRAGDWAVSRCRNATEIWMRRGRVKACTIWSSGPAMTCGPRMIQISIESGPNSVKLQLLTGLDGPREQSQTAVFNEIDAKQDETLPASADAKSCESMNAPRRCRPQVIHSQRAEIEGIRHETKLQIILGEDIRC